MATLGGKTEKAAPRSYETALKGVIEFSPSDYEGLQALTGLGKSETDSNYDW